MDLNDTMAPLKILPVTELIVPEIDFIILIFLSVAQLQEKYAVLHVEQPQVLHNENHEEYVLQFAI